MVPVTGTSPSVQLVSAHGSPASQHRDRGEAPLLPSSGMQACSGCGTALVTPFAQGGAVDERALRSIVEWQIAEGVHFLVPCGSTGEAATMTPEEQRRVIEIVVEVTNGRVPVVAGAASNDTQRAIALSKGAQAAGATVVSEGAAEAGIEVSPLISFVSGRSQGRGCRN